MDLATLTNAPREITLDGKTYKVSALTLAEWGELQQWIKDHADPVVEALRSLNRARADGVPIVEADRKALMAQARIESRSFPPSPGSLAWYDVLDNTEGGTAQLVAAILKKHQPGLPEAALTKLAGWVNEGENRPDANLLFFTAMGIPDPKTQPPDEGVTATPTPTVDQAPLTTGA